MAPVSMVTIPQWRNLAKLGRTFKMACLSLKASCGSALRATVAGSLGNTLIDLSSSLAWLQWTGRTCACSRRACPAPPPRTPPGPPQRPRCSCATRSRRMCARACTGTPCAGLYRTPERAWYHTEVAAHAVATVGIPCGCLPMSHCNILTAKPAQSSMPTCAPGPVSCSHSGNAHLRRV